MDKVVATALEAVADVPDDASVAAGGFGLSGVPNVLIRPDAYCSPRPFGALPAAPDIAEPA